MLLKIGDAERHDVLRVEQVALSKAHDTFSMATELHVSICYSFNRIRLSFDSKAIENAVLIVIRCRFPGDFTVSSKHRHLIRHPPFVGDIGNRLGVVQCGNGV